MLNKPSFSPNLWLYCKIAILILVTFILQYEILRLIEATFEKYQMPLFKHLEKIRTDYVPSVQIVNPEHIVYVMENTDLPALGKRPNYKTLKFDELNERQIFFHETSESGLLTLSQACGIESAALHHPKRWINLFLSVSSSPILLPPWLDIMQKYSNVRIILIDNESYFKDTLFSNWYRQGGWRLSEYKAAHLSDYLRMATAHRSGGLYMDIDLLVLREFPDHVFRNFFVYETGDSDLIANSVFHLERGHWASKKIANLIANDYNPHQYIYHGPEAFTEVVREICNASDHCNDLRVLPHTIMNPLEFQKRYLYYSRVTNESLALLNNTYAIHHFCLANYVSKDASETSTESTKLYAALAREHCPVTLAITNLKK